MDDSDLLQLGGSIQLSGFKGIGHAQMIVLKKIVGSNVKRYKEICGNFESLSLTMKPVHNDGPHAIYELHAKCMDNGKPIAAEGSDRNLFLALDSVLKKIEHEIQK